MFALRASGEVGEEVSVARELHGFDLGYELTRAQVETNTPVCRDAEQVRSELLDARRGCDGRAHGRVPCHRDRCATAMGTLLPLRVRPEVPLREAG